MSLRIVTIPLDKEAWENIAHVVVKSFNAYSTNITAIKKWTDKQEDKIHSMEEIDKDLEQRLEATQASLDDTKRRLEEVAAKLQETVDTHRQQVGDIGHCLGRLLRSSSSLQNHLVRAFGGILDDEEKRGPRAQRGSRLMGGRGSRTGSAAGQRSRSSLSPLGAKLTGRASHSAGRAGDQAQAFDSLLDGALPCAEDSSLQVDADGFSATLLVAPTEDDTLPRVEGFANIDGGGDEMTEPSKMSVSCEAPAAFEDRVANLLPDLQASASSVESRLAEVCDVVAQWANQRQAEASQRESMQATIHELETASQRTFDRLFAWRGLLKEGSLAIDSLGQSLAGTQRVVQELKATQVRQEDVDQVVNAKGQELHDLHNHTNARVNGLERRVDKHVGDVELMIAQMRKQLEDRVDESGAQLARVLERNLNPVNAYLNKMGVKADTARVQLDALNLKVPLLATRLDEVATELKACDDASRTRSGSLSEQVERLNTNLSELKEGTSKRGEELGSEIVGLSQQIANYVDDTRKSLTSTSGQLESLRASEVSVIGKNLTILEHKVAKWVHAMPLPAKVSEARLFSLEARLAEETDARLNIEHVVGMKSGRLALTPRPADNGMLPHLPTDGCGGARGLFHDAHRQSYAAR